MNGRRAIVGLCMACALLVSAFAAQSASAAPSTTSVTCKFVGPGKGTHGDNHCKTEKAGGEWTHVSFAPDTTTSLRVGSKENTTLKSTVGGLGVTLISSELELVSSPWVMNALNGNNEHSIYGEGKITYKGVTVSGFSGKCFVYEDGAGKAIGEKEMVTTEKLLSTTQGVEGGMGMKIAPNEGNVFARFWILDKNKKTSAEGGECSIGATYVVSGSLVATPEGATLRTTHAGVTTENKLKMGPTEEGAKAGLEGQVTTEGEDTVDPTDTWTPLSSTTVTG